MLRLAGGLAVLVLSARAGPAAAQTAEAAQAAAAAAAAAKNAADAIILTGPIGALFILVVIGLIVACGGLGFVIRALWRTIQGRDIMIAALQEKRASDAATSSKLLAEAATTGSASISANTEAQAKLTDRMQTFADVVRPLGPDLTRVLTGLDRNFDKLADVEKAVGAGCRA